MTRRDSYNKDWRLEKNKMECDINNNYNGWAVMIEQGYILINGEWVLEDE